MAFEIVGRARLLCGRPRQALRAFQDAEAHADANGQMRLDCLRVRPLLLLDRPVEASEAAQRAVEAAGQRGDDLTTLRALLALADWHVHAGDPGTARKLCRRAAALMSDDAPDSLRASLALAHANALAAAHRFGAARRHFALALAHLPEDDVGLRLRVEYDAARAVAQSGGYPAAARAFLEIETTMCRLGHKRLLGRIQLERAEIELRLDRPEEAQVLAARAHDRFAAAGLRRQQARAHHVAACAAARLGDVFLAVDALMDAERLYAQLRSVEPWVACLVQLGDLFLRHGREDEARSAGARASALLNARAHPLTRATVELLQSRLDLAAGETTRALHRVDAIRMDTRDHHAPWLHLELHRLMGRCYAQRGQFAEAIVAQQHAIVVLEGYRGGDAPPEHHAAFQASRRELYAETADLMARAGYPDLAFAVAERARARAIVELMADDTTAGRARLVARTARRLRALRERLNATYDFVLRAGARGLARGADKTAEARNRAGRLETELEALLQQARATDAEAASLHVINALDLATVRAQIDPDTVLLEYVVMDDALLTFVVTRDRLRVVRQDVSAEELRKLVGQFHFHMRKLNQGAEFAATMMLGATRRVLTDIAVRLLKPLGDLSPATKLIVVPDGVLHNLPFHALPDGPGWLADRFEVVYAPSATMYATCRLRQPHTTGPAAVFGLHDEAAPGLEAEAQAVAQVLRSDRLVLGEDATLSRLRNEAARARMIHLAARSMSDASQPMRSGVRLADTWLDLYGICDLVVPAELVVLSATECDNAEVNDGDEVVGLTRGFLHAGARALLANRWDVADGSKVEFMQFFYGLLEEKGDPSAALHETMARMRAQRPHPYYWAAFHLSGCPVVRRFRDEPVLERGVRHVRPIRQASRETAESAE